MCEKTIIQVDNKKRFLLDNLNLNIKIKLLTSFQPIKLILKLTTFTSFQHHLLLLSNLQKNIGYEV